MSINIRILHGNIITIAHVGLQKTFHHFQSFGRKRLRYPSQCLDDDLDTSKVTSHY